MFSNEQILNIFELCNPWWKSNSFPKSKNYDFKRNDYYRVKKLIDTKTTNSILLSGLRRVGKTTIMNQFISEFLLAGMNPQNIIYITFDHPIIKILDISNILNAYNTIYPIKEKIKNGEKIWIFLDEVQYSEELPTWINSVQYIPNINIMATCSAKPINENKNDNIFKLFADTIHMVPLSFYEYCSFIKVDDKPDFSKILSKKMSTLSDDEINFLVKETEKIAPHFTRYLYLGGFPEFIANSSNPQDMKLRRNDAVTKIIKADLQEVYSIRNVKQVEKVFLYLCLKSSYAINIEKMSKQLDNMNKISIHNYLDFLTCGNIIYDSEPVPLNGEIHYKSRPKVYIADASIRNAVLLTDKTVSSDSEIDNMVEAVIYRHFIKTFGNKAQQTGYYRKALGNHSEIDIISKFDNSYFICDVQYVDNPVITTDDIFFETANSSRHNIDAAILVTKKLDDFGLWSEKTKTPIIRIPACTFLYMLGQLEVENLFNSIE